MTRTTDASVSHAFEAVSTGVAALLLGLLGPLWAAAVLTGAALTLSVFTWDRLRSELALSAPARARLGGLLATAGAAGLLWSAWTVGLGGSTGAASGLAGLLFAAWGLLVLLSGLTYLVFGEGFPPSEEERREAFEDALRSTVEGGRP